MCLTWFSIVVCKSCIQFCYAHFHFWLRSIHPAYSYSDEYILKSMISTWLFCSLKLLIDALGRFAETLLHIYKRMFMNSYRRQDVCLNWTSLVMLGFIYYRIYHLFASKTDLPTEHSLPIKVFRASKTKWRQEWSELRH